MSEITWYGHSAFKITGGGITLLVDPFLDGNPSCPISRQEAGAPDAVLVTHDHADHVGQTVEICKATKAMLACIVGTAERLIAAGVPQQQVLNGIGFNMGGTLDVKGAQLTMVPAFHTTESGQPAGYIIRMPDGCTIYHSGDTCLFGDMALWGNLYPLDLALLPIGGVFTMDHRQAAVACALLRPKKVLPMHWGTFPVLEQRTREFKEELQKTAPKCVCVEIAPGQTFTL
ncbi:MAG: metal-dependent hydrolase [Desulfovibrionaceae bacterium]|nr:metal-dependent hydrolase [Desulfovibrionaceae bacterium]